MKIFNTTNIAAFFITSTMMLTSCEAVKNANNQQKGTVIGTAAGAVIGGVLGNNLGKGKNAPAGAVLGGIVGGVAGNVIGRNMDKQAKEIKETLPGAEVERVGEGIKVTMKENMVNFGFDSSDLTSAAKANLDKLAQVLKNNMDTNINIYGHTDSKGTDAYNLSLSERRAAAEKTIWFLRVFLLAECLQWGLVKKNLSLLMIQMQAEQKTDVLNLLLPQMKK